MIYWLMPLIGKAGVRTDVPYPPVHGCRPDGGRQRDCWVVGDNVGSSGDIWYHTTFVYRINQVTGVGSAWTFAPFVDGAGAFHALPRLPHC